MITNGLFNENYIYGFVNKKDVRCEILSKLAQQWKRAMMEELGLILGVY
jgi:hypothetical protein